MKLKMLTMKLVAQVVAYANDLDAWIPEIWANESIAILENEMVIANLVHRDFENEVAKFGDIVHTRKPGEFTMKRKTKTDNVTVQDATATDIQVPLNMHAHVTFVVADEDMSKSFKDLAVQYLQPAVLAIAEGIDKTLLVQAPRFLRTADNRQAGAIGSAASIASITDLRTNLNIDLCPQRGRNLIITPDTENDLLNVADFTQADKLGDDGTALREASLGRKFGFDIYMCQQAAAPLSTQDTVTGAVNNGAGYAAGISTMTVDGFSAAITNGTWFTVAGDKIPHRITSTVGGATPTSLTFTPALKTAVVDNAVITLAAPTWLINNSGGYAAGYAKYITIDTGTNNLQVGQFVQFAAGGDMYGIIEASATQILLDRPLVASVADNAPIFQGPIGQYNFAFTRNALAFVNRPLVMIPEGTGAKSYVANANGLAIRVTWAYDKDLQGMQVTVDLLYGLAVLDTDLAEVMLA